MKSSASESKPFQSRFKGEIPCRAMRVANLRIQPSFLTPRPLGRFAGETSAPKRQKIHTDDVNQCLHNSSL